MLQRIAGKEYVTDMNIWRRIVNDASQALKKQKREDEVA